MRRFNPVWYTIPAFAKTSPQDPYHKEQEQREMKTDALQNLHVLARAELNIEMEPEHPWLLDISADDYYKLYVNGAYAGEGPAPAYPEQYYYNTIDITRFLKTGKNVLAVHLYYQGLVNRVWNSGDGRFALAAKLRQLPRPLEWKYEICRAYSGETVGYDTQFLENFDSRLWERDWKEPDYDDHSWERMVPADWADYRLFPQPVKMLSVYEMEPRTFIRTGPGHWFIDAGQEVTGSLRITAEGVSGSKVRILCGEELLQEQEDGSSAAANTMDENSGQKTSAEKSDQEESQGPSASHNSLSGGKTGKIVKDDTEEDQYEDAAPDSGCVRWHLRCGCDYEEEWILGEGISEYVPYDYKGFRYAELITEDSVEIRHICIQLRHYPLDESRCTLYTDAPYVEQIFQICRQAVKLCTQWGYLDCSTREKGQYLGDAVITSRSQVWLSGTTEMLRKCIREFALTEKICPGLMAVAPGSLMQEIADFSLLWSQLLMTDYQFTGDRDFLKAYYPTAKNLLRHFAQYERGDGLLDQVSDKWNLVDWPENLRDGYDFTLSRPIVALGCHNVINALYIGAGKTLCEMEDILGLPRSWDVESRKASYIRAFYRPGPGLFADSETSSHCAIHSNLYPLYFGLVPEKARKSAADFLAEKGFCCGVMTSYYLLKALAKAGRYEAVYRLLVNPGEHGWVHMLSEGATACFEAWGKDQKWNTSLCHPWASAPISILIEEIAGLRLCPERPEGFEFAPHIPEEVEDFRLKVPFRGKSIFVEKEKGRVSLQSRPLI